MNKRKPRDQEARDEILNSNYSNYLISASAGSGKTTILVEKAISLIKNKKIKNYQKILMITFTRRATEQIRERIEEKMISEDDASKSSNIRNKLKVSTTESFVINEVIKLFMREVLGKTYPLTEKIRENYNVKFNTFEEGIKVLKEKCTLGRYYDNKKNFMYELGYYILKNSINAQKYLKAKYPYLMIDEYQDVDYDMHKLYMYLKNTLKLNLFVVGDIKQAIFEFRGADPKIFKELISDEDFKTFKLIENFRSHMSIVKYSYNFEDSDINIGNVNENKVYFYDNTSLEKIIKHIVSQYKEEQIAYLFARKDIFKNIETYLKLESFQLVNDAPMNTAYPEYYYFEPLLKYYFSKANYNKFNIMKDLELNSARLSVVNELDLIIADLQLINYESGDNNQIENIIMKFENLLKLKFSTESKQKLFKTLHDDYRINFAMEEYKRIALTIHKSKGLEFDHVITDAESFYSSNKFNEELHYVSITRPKESLHIILNEKYKDYLRSKNISFNITEL